nr:Translation initiation factor IF-2 like [Ipomoea batatas]
MENFEQIGGGNALNRPKEGVSSFHAGRDACKKVGADEKKAAVHEEMTRLSRLPQNSAYVSHRTRVLNKILQLLSIQRTTSQDEELELLFAGLSLG